MYYDPEPIPANLPKVTAPLLGTWCIVKAKAIKVHEPDSALCTEWMREPIEPVQMMFIGIRKVREGYMHFGYENELGEGQDRSFVAKRFIDVWLFVPDAYKKPVHVLPVDAEILPF